METCFWLAGHRVGCDDSAEESLSLEERKNMVNAFHWAPADAASKNDFDYIPLPRHDF